MELDNRKLIAGVLFVAAAVGAVFCAANAVDWTLYARGVRLSPRRGAWDFGFALAAVGCLAVSIGSAIYLRACGRPARHGFGDCQFCGYDLTGNESGRCPECGGRIGA